MIKRRQFLFSWAGALLAAGILIALNILSSLAFIRLDFSEGGAYSLSSGTKAVLKNIEDSLVIKVYFTARLPQPHGRSEQYLRDLLKEYKRASRGRVKVEFSNPENDAEIQIEARNSGVTPIKLSVMGGDQFEIKEAYMGLILLYRGKMETIPVIQNAANLEYDITRRIRKLAGAPMKTVGLVTGHGEISAPDGPLKPVLEAVGEQMNIETVALDKPLSAHIDALWIIGPQKPYRPDELERLKAWVGSGRTLGLLLDRRGIELHSFSSYKINTGLDPLLSAWGVEAREGFVTDSQAERIQLRSRQGTFTVMNVVDYPYIPVATNINARHPATRGLDAVAFPFVHPIVVKTDAALKYTSLFDSTPASWYRTDAALSPFQPPTQNIPENKGPFSMAGTLEGDFFKVTPSKTAALAGEHAPVQAPGRVILAGTSRMIHPDFSAKSANTAAFLNLLAWSANDEAMLSLRAKGMTFRPLRTLSDTARLVVKYVLIFDLPASLLLVALVIYQRQKIRRRLLPALYRD